jgi:hypothetical protein
VKELEDSGVESSKMVHDEEQSGRPSVVSDDLVQCVDQKISELSCGFPQISCTAVCELITGRLDYHKFWARWVPKMLMGAYKIQRMASALTSLEG